ncbi:hypothetical protein ACFSJY_00860 [Thalassotalea euphylliae]|uniref:hypothetical protein n=1 Tax=Thalassotalea euphylliae TaxID=1655234 RepID=UPI00363134C8
MAVIFYEDGKESKYVKTRFAKSIREKARSDELAEAIVDHVETRVITAERTHVSTLREYINLSRTGTFVPLMEERHSHLWSLDDDCEDMPDDLFATQLNHGKRLMEVVQALEPYTKPIEVAGKTQLKTFVPGGVELMGLTAYDHSYYDMGLSFTNYQLLTGQVLLNRFYALATYASGTTPNGGKWTFEQGWVTICLCFDKPAVDWLIAQLGRGEAAAAAAIIAAIPDIGPLLLAAIGLYALALKAASELSGKGACLCYTPFIPMPTVIVLPNY